MKTSLIVRPFGGLGAGLGLLFILLLIGPARADGSETTVIDLRNLPPLEQIVPVLADKRVVFVGEIHDQYSHHLAQRDVIRALHQRHGDMAIGMEQFQQPFQAHLDAFVAGEIDEETMLRRTQYMERWRFDYRLYRPILQYAREHRIPLVALNVPRDLIARVAEQGLASLTREEKAQLPEIDSGNDRYRERLRAAYQAHPAREGGKFEYFLEAQLLWDESMAEKAADYLRLHPERHMVILAGSGHLAHRDGIPQRLERRLKVSSAVVLNDPQETMSRELADFVLLPGPASLPPKGMMGLLMDGADQRVRVVGFAESSAAQAAGVAQGDRIVAVDGEAVASTTDVELALLDRKPGEKVELAVLRQAGTENEKRLSYRIELR